MPDPTLADVLAALDTEEPVDFAFTARRYFEVNREALERFELEQAARWAVNAEQWQTVVVAQRSKEPPEFVTVTTSQPRGEPNGVLVGANWKPEVGR